MALDLSWECRFGHPARVIAGVDEVGRGCLAGPVVVGAVVLPADLDLAQHPWMKEIADSKLLTADKREELAPQIERVARGWSIGQASVEEIDKLNIFHASHLAMLRAVAGISRARGFMIDHILVDGKFLPKEWQAVAGRPAIATAIIKGDLQVMSIACASILAKVWRDKHLVELDRDYPGYGLASHKGYSTPAHKAALKKLGAAKVHRRSFSPVGEQVSRQPRLL